MNRPRPRVALRALVLSVSFVAPAIAAPQTCVDYTSFMRPLGDVPAPASIEDVALSGGYLFAASPRLGGFRTGGGFGGGWFATDVVIYGPAAYVMEEYYSGNPHNPYWEWAVRQRRPGGSGSAFSIGGVGVAHSVEAAGSLLFVAEPAGLRLFDVSDPDDVETLSTIPAPAYATGADRNVLLVSGGGEMRLYDISDPRAPQYLATSPVAARRIVVRGAHAYVLTYEEGVHVLSVEDPENPEFVGAFDTPGDVYDVAVDGGNLLVADGLVGLSIYDLLNPAAPVLGATVELPGATSGVSGRSGVAYALSDRGDLTAIDVLDPRSPLPLGGAAADGYGWGIAAGDEFVCIANQWSWFFPTHCAMPTAIALSSFTASRNGSGVDLTWEASAPSVGVTFDVFRGCCGEPRRRLTLRPIAGLARGSFRDPDPPVEGAAYWLLAHDAAGRGDEWLGPAMLSAAAAPPVVALHAVQPNPSSGRATIRYAISRAARVRLAVYDVRGRHCATLVDAHQDAGEHVAVWDGRARRGGERVSGAYWVRLESGGSVRTSGIVLAD